MFHVWVRTYVTSERACWFSCHIVQVHLSNFSFKLVRVTLRKHNGGDACRFSLNAVLSNWCIGCYGNQDAIKGHASNCCYLLLFHACVVVQMYSLVSIWRSVLCVCWDDIAGKCNVLCLQIVSHLCWAANKLLISTPHDNLKWHSSHPPSHGRMVNILVTCPLVHTMGNVVCCQWDVLLCG